MRIKCNCGREVQVPEDKEVWIAIGKTKAIEEVLKIVQKYKLENPLNPEDDDGKDKE